MRTRLPTGKYRSHLGEDTEELAAQARAPNRG
jgi:hypothetical protein